jgi:hypothetical protein
VSPDAMRPDTGIPGVALSGVVARDQGKAQAWLESEGISRPGSA